jgi:diadenosine tetraphosphate (Ap4A) HIT family hydrolase
MAQEPLMNIGNARTELQVENMKKIEAEGFCPFCPENIEKYHTPPILRTKTHWYVTPNMYPYDNTKHHFLFITTAHITDTKELTAEAWAELGEHISWIIETYQIPNGTLLMRSGDMTKTGATVMHLHAQFIVGESKDKPVMARVG